MTAKFTVGQKLWYVPYANDRGFFVTVEEVGLQWITLARGRMSRATIQIDDYGYTSSGRCYSSREEWESDRALKAAWRSSRDQFSRSRMPADVSLADIKAAAAKLGLKIED